MRWYISDRTDLVQSAYSHTLISSATAQPPLTTTFPVSEPRIHHVVQRCEGCKYPGVSDS